MVDVADLMYGVVLYRHGNRRFGNKVVFAVFVPPAIGKFEQHFKSALSIVDELVVAGFAAAQFCHNTGSFRMACKIGNERIHLELRHFFADFLQNLSHFIIECNNFLFCSFFILCIFGRIEPCKLLHRLIIQLIQFFEVCIILRR